MIPKPKPAGIRQLLRTAYVHHVLNLALGMVPGTANVGAPPGGCPGVLGVAQPIPCQAAT